MFSINWIKNNKVKSLYIFVVILAGFCAAYFSFNFGLQIATDTPKFDKRIFILFGGAVVGLIFLLTTQGYEIQVLKRKTNWLIDATNWNIKRIRADQNPKEDAANSINKTEIPNERWPWGQHHTETLGHLEAAARKYWVLYDPNDISTAPTNEMVIEWLQSDRGISREKARAIASMLRPDGLPTGPRR